MDLEISREYNEFKGGFFMFKKIGKQMCEIVNEVTEYEKK